MSVNRIRRRMLQGALAAGGGLLIPYRYALAQIDAAALLSAAKQALIIGNGNYRHERLKSPANDARAMADALKVIGFETDVGLDWTRTQMDNAIRQFTEKLTRRNTVGLFYFAGHGAQLAWRNYAVPVNAEVETTAELLSRCIDLNTVIDNMRRAGNPINLVILDACRDNPLGKHVRPDRPGLSQIDAPPDMLVAFATAPGNTVIDGEEQHALFTEHLLREIKVPESKVEDVFKRVRMGVRRRSSGRQIPWECNSLKDDFWFVPPEVLKKPPKFLKALSEEEIEREFKDESAAWDGAQKANEPAALEAYLSRYPSGRFSEVALAKLDRIRARLGEKKVEVVWSPQNPYSKGSLAIDTNYQVGDSYTYRIVDILTRALQRERTLTVTDIVGDEVIFDQGGTVTDLLGNLRKLGGEIWKGSRMVPAEFHVGRQWNTRFRYISQNGEAAVSLQLHVADRETIRVPAGSFDAFRVEAHGWANWRWPMRPSQWNWKIWFAPDVVRRLVAWEMMHSKPRLVRRDRWELVAYKQG